MAKTKTSVPEKAKVPVEQPMEMRAYRVPGDVHIKLQELATFDGRKLGRMLAEIVRAAHKEVFGDTEE